MYFLPQFGELLLALALGTALFAALSALGGERWRRISRIDALCSAICALASGAVLYALFLGDHFEVAYVAGYSSKSLPLLYKLSAFWAGQQGSFLLWLVFHAVALCVLLRQAATAAPEREGLMNAVLGIFSMLAAVLAMLTLAKSPFELIADVPVDGAGMNPLLMDPWMAVHPPILFLGYALLAVPLAYSCAALLTNAKAKLWLASARSFTLVAWSFLGAGIFIGAYWAYKVLGWGGFWGWDPVENSSLVPWLLACALLHLLTAARAREGVLPVLHLAAIFTYAFVLYGTFLTRSGILGDFSVHSFAGTSIGLTLAVVNGLVLLAGLALLFFRAQTFPQTAMYETYASRPFILLLGSLVLAFIAAIVFVGMSMPLLTQLAGSPAAVDTGFYTRTTAPLALVLAALMVYAFYKKWMQRKGAIVAHVGTLLALVAIVASASGGSQSVTLAPGETQTVLGHEVTFLGQTFSDTGDAKTYDYTVDGEPAKALTKLKESGEDAAREPAILRHLTGDLYLAPTPPESAHEEILLKRGHMQMDDLYAYRYDDIEMTPEGDHMRVTADIAITDGATVEHAQPVILATETGGKSEPIAIMNGAKRIRLTGVSGNQETIRLELLPSISELASENVTVSFSTKPFIWVLFASAIAVVAGGFLAAKES